ncbi:MAG: hypothetical protein IPJ65_05795 [Archangiaceae bacterium]|nr:hypothetical protein [Archangiaceae bacterium]
MTPARMTAMHERGRAAWPSVTVKPEELAALLQAQGAAGDDETGRDAAELYLACALRRGDELAIAAFKQTYFAGLEPMLTAMGLGGAQRDEVWQLLSVRLLVTTDEQPPRIVGYAGRGQLRGLVKVASTRLALDLRGPAAAETVSDAWLEQLPAAVSSPELRWMKARHRDELKQELEAAISQLEARDRALLRLNLVERVGIDAIATAYQAHRATVARWVNQARGRLIEQVRLRLMERWRISADELDQLGAMIDSQVDLSLERLLATG